MKLKTVEGELVALGQRVQGTKRTAKAGGEVNVEFTDNSPVIKEFRFNKI